MVESLSKGSWHAGPSHLRPLLEALSLLTALQKRSLAPHQGGQVDKTTKYNNTKKGSRRQAGVTDSHKRHCSRSAQNSGNWAAADGSVYMSAATDCRQKPFSSHAAGGRRMES